MLLGLAVFSLPALGPVVIAGPIYTTVMGASAGGIGGGLLGSLVEMGVPKRKARSYREGVRRGHTLVAIEAGEEDVSRIQAIMNAHNPIDVEARRKGAKTQSMKQPLTNFIESSIVIDTMSSCQRYTSTILPLPTYPVAAAAGRWRVGSVHLGHR